MIYTYCTLRRKLPHILQPEYFIDKHCLWVKKNTFRNYNLCTTKCIRLVSSPVVSSDTLLMKNNYSKAQQRAVRSLKIEIKKGSGS